MRVNKLGAIITQLCLLPHPHSTFFQKDMISAMTRITGATAVRIMFKPIERTQTKRSRGTKAMMGSVRKILIAYSPE
ncbi:hypothetical protein EI94DRAFT_1790858 [Lactarius quietus]|nr:hypothetical protein EI94DRAFT_1790858 [Lactarius quietus]